MSLLIKAIVNYFYRPQKDSYAVSNFGKSLWMQK